MDMDDPDDIFGERKVKQQELPSASYSNNSKAYYDEYDRE